MNKNHLKRQQEYYLEPMAELYLDSIYSIYKIKAISDERANIQKEEKMRQKKVMKLWQMMVIILLSMVMLITMFLPAYHMDANTLKKSLENAQEEENYYESDKIKEQDILWFAKKYEKALKKEKAAYDTDLSSISGFEIMTNSLVDLLYKGKEDVEFAKFRMGKTGEMTYLVLNKKHVLTKIILWIVYSFALLVILVVVLGYCLKFVKYIPFVFSAVYGGVSAILFGILRFGIMGGIQEEVRTQMQNFIGFQFENIDTAKFASEFISYGFLIGLLTAVALLIGSIVFMLTGKDEIEEEGVVLEESVEEIQNIAPFGNIEKETVREEYKEKFPPTVAQILPSSQPVSKNGKVCCTKGMTSGSSGYSIPQDRKVVVGKSPHQANLVIINNARISNIHCTIRYQANSDRYIVKDHSMNGTYINGKRLQKDVSVECPAGTILVLADGSAEITLG